MVLWVVLKVSAFPILLILWIRGIYMGTPMIHLIVAALSTGHFANALRETIEFIKDRRIDVPEELPQLSEREVVQRRMTLRERIERL